MTKRAGLSASNDPGLAALLQAKSDAICFVAKSWDYQVRVALGCTNEENLDAIRDSVEAANAAGKEAMVDCEHFFDGFKANPGYALACAKTAYDAGARWVVLCDTNGGTHAVGGREHRRQGDRSRFRATMLGIHAHDDTGQAVANSLAAVEAGVRQIQGTLNGIGERCGNANLISLIPTLRAEAGLCRRASRPACRTEAAGRPHAAVARVRRIAQPRARTARRPMSARRPSPPRPASMPRRWPRSRRPTSMCRRRAVGNRRKVMVSDQGGKANFIAELERAASTCREDDPRLDALIAVVKEREAEGYAYEGADAVFELLARRVLGTRAGILPRRAVPLQCRAPLRRQRPAEDGVEAIVKVEVDGEELMSVAEGHGPVNALDIALRKDLGKYQDEIADLELVDYKVRILNGGTEAITRVLIESHDATGERWWTVGVSDNIIDASFQALMDSIVYKLMKSGAPA